ncbi:MAG: molecular chaperone [Halocynthiibacter sp.]
MTQTNQTREHEFACHDLAGTATERAQFYRLLAAIFCQEPGKELLEQLRSRRVQNLLSQSGIELGDGFVKKPMHDLQEELSEEFTRLFLGPGKHISPHESVQLKRGSGTLWGDKTVLVKRFIEAAGFDYGHDFSGIPDHVSVELEFLALLTQAEADNWATGDQAAARNVLEWQLDFIARHAGKWVPRFCGKVAKEAKLPFYRVFSKFLVTFMTGEKAQISACLHNDFPQGRDLPKTHPAALDKPAIPAEQPQR